MEVAEQIGAFCILVFILLACVSAILSTLGEDKEDEE